MYHKQKLHKGSQASCEVCMARISQIDPAYAEAVRKSAASKKKPRKQRFTKTEDR